MLPTIGVNFTEVRKRGRPRKTCEGNEKECIGERNNHAIKEIEGRRKGVCGGNNWPTIEGRRRLSPKEVSKRNRGRPRKVHREGCGVRFEVTNEDGMNQNNGFQQKVNEKGVYSKVSFQVVSSRKRGRPRKEIETGLRKKAKYNKDVSSRPRKGNVKGKGVGKQVEQPVEWRGKYDQEMYKYRTVCHGLDFNLAVTCFNKKFNCSENCTNKLVKQDLICRNLDNISCIFRCGCNNAKFYVQFRHYFETIEVVNGEKHYVFQVFIKKATLQETVSHFISLNDNIGTAVTFPITVPKEIPKRGRPRKKSPRSMGMEMHTRETNIVYAHHHSRRFLGIPVYNRNKDKPDNEKLQVISDGTQIRMRNIINGVISLQYPICVSDSPESIGMKVEIPGSTSNTSKMAYNIRQIASVVGFSTAVNVIDVQEQKELQGWTIGDLVEYFEEDGRIQKLGTMGVLNQVSFEFSRTALEKFVRSPEIVREIDWICNGWPQKFQLGNGSNSTGVTFFPIIQYYCVTSSVGAYMDFHIDLGGTSFWYHLVCGSKNFVLIEPTKLNLQVYESWAGKENKERIFLPDLILDKSTIIHVILQEKETIIVPSGWIHAVYTGMDSLVFGGNFLHGFAIEMQILINEMEIRSNVKDKFRCPYFDITHIFAANMILNRLESITKESIDTISEVELQQLPCLMNYIVSEYKKCINEVQESASCVTRRKKLIRNEPKFVDAVNYVFREQNCRTLTQFVQRMFFGIAKVYREKIGKYDSKICASSTLCAGLDVIVAIAETIF
jgi:Jumonji helical domain/AT hook motif